MKKWIRGKGLIAFLAVVAISAVVWFFLVDRLAKRAIEKAGAALAGAKVELAKADVTLFPLGMTLAGLQVTDKEKPMANAVEVSRMAFHIDSMNLLRRKVIISEVAAEGIRFGTPRKYSGAVAKEPEKKAAAPSGEQGFRLPSVEMPDVKKVLKEEPLDSLKQIEAARAEMQSARTSWQKRVDELPDRVAFEEYKKRIDSLRKAKPKGAKEYKKLASGISALTKDLDRDIERVKKAREEFGTSFIAAKNRLAEAEKAPGADVERIMDKHSLSSAGLQNISRMLFGKTINDWVWRGFLWYGRLKPVLERSKEKKGAQRW